MTMYGADAQQLEVLAASLDRAAGELDSIQRTLGARVRTVAWPGRDGDHFRHQWQGQLGATLVHTLQQLESAAALVRRNADEQRRASGETVGGASSPSGLPIPGGTSTPWLPWLPGLPPIIGVPGYPGLPLPFPLPPGIGLRDLLPLLPPLQGVADYVERIWAIAEGAEGLLQLDHLRDVLTWDGASSAFGLLSGAAWLTGQFFDEGSGGRLLAEGAGHALDVAAAGGYLLAGAPALTGVLGRIGPGVGIATGSIGMATNVYDMVQHGVTVENGLGLASSGLLTAGSVAMLVPGGQVVGGALILTGTAIEAGEWVYDNWDQIEGYLDDGADIAREWAMTTAGVVTDVGGQVLQGAGRVLDSAGDVVADVGGAVQDVADVVDGGLDALGDGIGALGKGLGGLFGG